MLDICHRVISAVKAHCSAHSVLLFHIIFHRYSAPDRRGTGDRYLSPNGVSRSSLIMTLALCLHRLRSDMRRVAAGWVEPSCDEAGTVRSLPPFIFFTSSGMTAYISTRSRPATFSSMGSYSRNATKGHNPKAGVYHRGGGGGEIGKGGKGAV
jgi:hypothetical protein